MAAQLSPLQQAVLDRADSIMAGIANSVTKVSDVAVNAATKAKDFAAEQIPDIAIQYITYGRAIETTMVLLGVLIMAAALTFMYQTTIKNVFKFRDNDGKWFIAIIFGLPTFIAGACVFGTNIAEFFMVWAAPKVWLIRELVNIVK